jgi:O-antigen/teichoic acid export membrane protein
MQTDETSSLTTDQPVDVFAEPDATSVEIASTRRVATRLSWLVAWGIKGGLAVVDQALFAGAQFALNIVLAWWLSPSGYGAFAVAYSMYLLAVAVHNALLVEPMIVFGSGRHFDERRNYLGIVIRAHWLLTIPIGLLLFAGGVVVSRIYSLDVAHALYALSLALPLTLFAELTRRAFYIEMKPGRAAAGGAVYFCTLLGLVLWLRTAGFLTPAIAILAMGAAALLTSGLQLVWLHSLWPHGTQKLLSRGVASEHWGYGRWVLAAVFPSWTLLNLYYMVLPAWFGLKEAGALKALMNLAMPASQSVVAFGGLVLPLLVRHRNKGGARQLGQTVRRVATLFLSGAAAYLLLLWVFHVQIMSLLYAGKYLEYAGLPVFLVGLVPLVTACTVTLVGASSASERPDRIFWANVVASCFSLTVGLWMVSAWGLLGAISGYLISYGLLAAVLWILFSRSRIAASVNAIS